MPKDVWGRMRPGDGRGNSVKEKREEGGRGK